jgi:hypothetical protein
MGRLTELCRRTVEWKWTCNRPWALVRYPCCKLPVAACVCPCCSYSVGAAPSNNLSCSAHCFLVNYRSAVSRLLAWTKGAWAGRAGPFSSRERAIPRWMLSCEQTSMASLKDFGNRESKSRAGRLYVPRICCTLRQPGRERHTWALPRWCECLRSTDSEASVARGAASI